MWTNTCTAAVVQHHQPIYSMPTFKYNWLICHASLNVKKPRSNHLGFWVVFCQEVMQQVYWTGHLRGGQASVYLKYDKWIQGNIHRTCEMTKDFKRIMTDSLKFKKTLESDEGLPIVWLSFLDRSTINLSHRILKQLYWCYYSVCLNHMYPLLETILFQLSNTTMDGKTLPPSI